MVSLNKACTNAAPRSQLVDDRGSKRILHYNYFQNATYAYTIYVPQTYAWSVSTRLVLMQLPVPSPSTTEDKNASTLQLFSECHLRLHYICTAKLCMVGLNKACTNAAPRSQLVDDRGSKRILHYNYFQNATYAYTIYVPQTYAWSVSTRLVLMQLPVPSPSTTEDKNASALQLFSECHLRLHYICTAKLCMVGLNKACTNASARSKPVDDRG